MEFAAAIDRISPHVLANGVEAGVAAWIRTAPMFDTTVTQGCAMVPPSMHALRGADFFGPANSAGRIG